MSLIFHILGHSRPIDYRSPRLPHGHSNKCFMCAWWHNQCWYLTHEIGCCDAKNAIEARHRSFIMACIRQTWTCHISNAHEMNSVRNHAFICAVRMTGAASSSCRDPMTKICTCKQGLAFRQLIHQHAKCCTHDCTEEYIEYMDRLPSRQTVDTWTLEV